MYKKSLLGVALLAAGISTASAVPYGLSDARSVAMGNVNVATGGVTSAAFGNPAMLKVNETDDTFVLHIGVGAAVLENGNVTDDIDRYQELEDQINAIDTTDSSNADQLLPLLNEQIELINDLDGDSLMVRAAPNMALIYGGDMFSVAVTAELNGYVSGAISDVSGIPTSPLTEQQIIDDITNNSNLTYDPDARLRAIGVVTTEIGVSIATDLDILGMKVALGIKPKSISAEAINYDQTLATADVDDIVDDTAQDLGSITTMDAGMVISFSDSLRLGLVAKNVLSETLTVTTNGTSYDVDFDTHMRIGVAYNTSFMTIAADMDITETDPVLIEDPTRMAALGVELNAFDFMQIRAGYQTNLASGASADDIISAGVGFWFGFNLDIAAVASEDSVGAYIQTGFRF